ncbi:olfactory receptor 5 isoform X1 [Bombyx mori]|uniref:olfactory receptor 5 isoform X1 n=1 Tax=Bombyx mori TaxID=7091 RepID=UPI002ED42DAD
MTEKITGSLTALRLGHVGFELHEKLQPHTADGRRSGDGGKDVICSASTLSRCLNVPDWAPARSGVRRRLCAATQTKVAKKNIVIIRYLIALNPSFARKVNNVEEFTYMKFLKSFCKIMDFWPEREEKNSKTRIFRLRYILVLQFCFTLVAGVLYLTNSVGKQTFYDLGHTIITVLMNVVSVSRLILRCFKKYDVVGQQFINKIHLYHYRNDSEYAMKIHTVVHKISHNMTYIFSFCIIFGTVTFNLTPIFNNIGSGAYKNPRPDNVTLQQCVYYALPFDYTGDFKWYLLVAIFNVQKTFFCTSLFILFELSLSLMIICLWGHLRIFIHNLNHIPAPRNSLEYTKEERQEVDDTLKKCIQHHTLIIGFVRIMSETYGLAVLIYYAFQQVVGCLLLLQCSQMELKTVTRFGFLTLVLNQQLIQISVIFELLGYMSDKLQDAVYCVPWEYMDTSHRKMVYMMFRQSQIPLQLKAMNMLSIGVKTMVSILKTSVTYYLILKTVTTDEA